MKVNVFEFLKDAAGKVKAEAKKEVIKLYEDVELAVLGFASKAAEKAEAVSERFKAALVELDAAAKEDRARLVAEQAGLTVSDGTEKQAAPAAEEAPAAERQPAQAESPAPAEGT